MRILIDLQGSQTASRHRGIGRFSTAIAKAIIRNRGDHEVLILLNGLFEDTIAPIKEEFSSILPADRIVVFSVPSPAQAFITENAWRIEAAELIREWVINALAPEVVLILSLFEGPIDPAVVSIGRLDTASSTVAVVHDLIPFLNPQEHLKDALVRRWYYSKIDHLRRADLIFTISDSARHEVVDRLGFDAIRAIPVYSAADERFARSSSLAADSQEFLNRIGVRRKFIMYASMFEPRKNFEGLIRAFALLPKHVRDNHQLVLLTGLEPHQATELRRRDALRRVANEVGLAPDEMVLAGYVSESELVDLYSLCTLFVFPSFSEGFGLPPLEAMCCGAAVVGSNTTSIPEVIGREDALFDPHSDRSIAALIERALTDEKFWQSLKSHAVQRSKQFSWDRSARLALMAIEGIVPSRPSPQVNQDIPILLGKIAAIRADVSPERKDLVAVADCMSRNERAVSQWVLGRSADTSGAGDARDGGPHVAENGDGPYDAIFVRKLYHIFHNREPDLQGFENHLRTLRSGREPHELVEGFLNSDEFSMRWASHRSAPGNRNASTGVPSDPVVQVIRHRVWGREDHPRILLLKLDHIGDFVMTLDAFRLIRDTWPKAAITLVCGTWNRSIAEQVRLFDRVVSYNFYTEVTGDYDKDAATKVAEYRALDLGTYDLAIDLRVYGDNRMLLSHTDAKYRAGYSVDDISLDLALPLGSEGDMMAHVGGRITALAAAVTWTFGTPAGGARDAILGGRSPVRLFKDGTVVGISPGTRNALRSWGRERFAELARILHSSGNYRFVLIGGNADRADTQFIADGLPKSRVADLAGTSPIADAPLIFAGLDLFIGGETGTTHMAALMGVPTLCIHSGVTNVDSWRPVGPRVVTLRGSVACSPCFLGTIEECRWGRRCMDIPPTRVAAEAIAMSKPSGGAAGRLRSSPEEVRSSLGRP